MVDALALGAEEGRDKLRGAANKLIRRFPNEETRYVEDIASLHEYIV